MELIFYRFILKFTLFRKFLLQSAESLIKEKAGSCFIPVCKHWRGCSVW